MKIIEIKDRNPTLLRDLASIWESSVVATHTFLSKEEISKIKKYALEAFKQVPILVVMMNEKKAPLAFMGICDFKLEMLFVSAIERGKGIGKELLLWGIEKYNIRELTVNEQNPQAIGFYEHMGFKIYKRKEVDEQGEPYPILYMHR